MGKIEEVVARELTQYKTDIAALHELGGKEVSKYQEKSTLYCSAGKTNTEEME